ncbi:MAG: hypothetical protein OEN50_16230 [Deltaproteobacteria bacterium]|nr:hypothetical protein [Deltaproteobacteria bacterium]
MKKSQFVQFLLTLFFGPLGLFYSSVAAALAFLIAAFVIGMMTALIGALIVWPVSILVGFLTVYRHNALVDKEDKKHQELIQATRARGAE